MLCAPGPGDPVCACAGLAQTAAPGLLGGHRASRGGRGCSSSALAAALCRGLAQKPHCELHGGDRAFPWRLQPVPGAGLHTSRHAQRLRADSARNLMVLHLAFGSGLDVPKPWPTFCALIIRRCLLIYFFKSRNYLLGERKRLPESPKESCLGCPRRSYLLCYLELYFWTVTR